MEKSRCHWAKSPASVVYHDTEWGVPLHDDAGLFEFLVLEGAQAGLSWETILAKRDRYRVAFDGFEPAVVTRYGKRKITSLLADAGIVRNRLKISSAVGNARGVLAIQAEFGSFDAYLRQYVGRTQSPPKTPADVPSSTPVSIALSSDLRKRGFRFVGPTIMYAFMQAVGMVNDHLASCYRVKEIRAEKAR